MEHVYICMNMMNRKIRKIIQSLKSCRNLMNWTSASILVLIFALDRPKALREAERDQKHTLPVLRNSVPIQLREISKQ